MVPLNGLNLKEPLLKGESLRVQDPPRPVSKARLGLSQFKYYIHDSVDSFRLQLLGELSEANLTELTGCWTTAKTSLADRKLLLDLRSLTKMDESSHQWIIAMVNEGALLLPDTFLAQGLAARPEKANRPLTGFIPRLLFLLRGGSRALAAPSSTQAQ